MKGSTIFCLTIGVIDFVQHLSGFIQAFFEHDRHGISPGLMEVAFRCGFNTYWVISGIMCILPLLFIYGTIKERPSFMWPWLLACFQIGGNFGYHVLQVLSHGIIKGSMGMEILNLLSFGIYFVAYAIVWIPVFIIFRRMFIADMEKRAKAIRS